MARRKIFGLDISDHSIEAVLLEKPLFSKPKVVSYSRVTFNTEVIRNGIIKNPAKLREKLVNLLASAKPKQIRTPYCIVSLPDSQAFTSVFKFPAGLKRAEVKNTIPFKAEEIIPFDNSEIYFDFKAIAINNGTQEVFYSAVPTRVVDGYVNVLKDSGLKPIAFDLESVSLSRALVDKKVDLEKVKGKETKGVLLIDIGARTTDFTVFDKNGVRHNAVSKIAGNRFTKSVMQAMGVENKEGEKLKMEVGFNDIVGKKKVPTALRKELKKVIDEAKKIITYYQEQTGRQVSSVILAGGTSLLPKIDKEFSEKLNLEVRIGDPLAKVIDHKKLIKLKAKSILFSNAFGTALRGLEKKPVFSDINLLPLDKKFKLTPDRKDKRTWRNVYIGLTLFIIFTLALSGLVLAKKKTDFDLYGQIISNKSSIDIMVEPDIDMKVLEELRKQFLLLENEATSTSTTTQDQVSTSTSTTTPEVVEEEPEVKIIISNTGTGYLNVRQGPGVDFERVGRVYTDEEYVLLEEEQDWYKIELNSTTEGWVYSIYAEILQEEVDQEAVEDL